MIPLYPPCHEFTPARGARRYISPSSLDPPRSFFFQKLERCSAEVVALEEQGEGEGSEGRKSNPRREGVAGSEKNPP